MPTTNFPITDKLNGKNYYANLLLYEVAVKLRQMLVQRENVRRQSTSCNFCNKGKLNEYHNGLRYPYEDVVTFKREGNGLCAAICEECLNELIAKAKVEFGNGK